MSIGILLAVERECFSVKMVEERGVPGIEWEMAVPRRDLMITLAMEEWVSFMLWGEGDGTNRWGCLWSRR